MSQLNHYRLLGKTGLRVSPICLGTMTFGTEWGWGSEKDAAKRIFQSYLEAGGNFIDTADAYTNGKSEALLGEFITESKTRDRVVLASKFTFGGVPGDPNSGGNNRKNIYRSLEGSLKRLQTDYIDLYWMHAWDTLTPVEEVIDTLDTLVRAGKIRYFGLSDVPAWYASRAQTLLEERGGNRVAALQLEYSLVSRNLEREHIPMAKELGLAICAWSPMAGGFLSGKYKREGKKLQGEGRIQVTQGSGNPVMEKFTAERNWKILDELLVVAKEMGRTPAEIALAWVASRPGITSTLIGATKIEQLNSNLKALELAIPDTFMKRLNECSQYELTELDHFFVPAMQKVITAGTTIERS